MVEIDLREAVLEPDIERDGESRGRLGDLLVASGSVSAPALAEAISAQQSLPGVRLGTVLVERGLLDERALTWALARQLRIPTADLRREVPTPDAAALLDVADAYDLNILPLRVTENVADVVIADPADPRVTARLRRLPVARVRLFLAPAHDIRAAISTTYRALTEIQAHVDEFESDQGIDAPAVTSIEVVDDDDAPVIQVVNKIVAQALRDRASDVHVEPVNDHVRVRYRVDGALQEVLRLPVNMGPALASRVKILAEMNIVERRRPQDGQFQMTIDDREVDIRVSTTATIWGEKVVLRLLDKSRSLLKLSDLGMAADSREHYMKAVRSPYGMVIVSGPTGSGKTTTLYATLTEIDRDDINVMTIEDPVEYVFPSANQIQINEQAEVTFASGLKSILRQDPDVILVGEVRDVETARIAVQSALTGHLVLSSLHATDSVAALYRLLDMGIEPFLIASSVTAIVAQRLVRRVCSACLVPYQPTPAELTVYEHLEGPTKFDFVRGEGCALCNHTGYRGRLGVYEVLTVTDDVREAVMAHLPVAEVRRLAQKEGLRTLSREAVRLVAADLTTIDEILRNVFVAGEQ